MTSPGTGNVTFQCTELAQQGRVVTGEQLLQGAGESLREMKADPHLMPVQQ